MKLFVSFIAGIGALLANTSSTMCLFWIYDEPNYPKELLR